MGSEETLIHHGSARSVQRSPAPVGDLPTVSCHEAIGVEWLWLYFSYPQRVDRYQALPTLISWSCFFPEQLLSTAQQPLLTNLLVEQ